MSLRTKNKIRDDVNCKQGELKEVGESKNRDIVCNQVSIFPMCFSTSDVQIDK